MHGSDDRRMRLAAEWGRGGDDPLHAGSFGCYDAHMREATIG